MKRAPPKMSMLYKNQASYSRKLKASLEDSNDGSSEQEIDAINAQPTASKLKRTPAEIVADESESAGALGDANQSDDDKKQEESDTQSVKEHPSKHED